VLAQAAVFNIVRVLFAMILVAVPHAMGLGALALLARLALECRLLQAHGDERTGRHPSCLMSGVTLSSLHARDS